MGSYRTQLKGLACSEILANSLKSKAPEDGLTAKKVKRPKRGEGNHIPDIPTGETPENLENERLSSKEAQQSCSGKGQNGQDFFTAKTGHCGKGISSGRVDREMACIDYNG